MENSEHDFEKHFLNDGPDSKQIFLRKAEDAYKRGCETESIYYQVRALYQANQDRYFAGLRGYEEENLDEVVLNAMSQREKDQLERDPFLREVLHAAKQSVEAAKDKPKPVGTPRDFLSNIPCASDGYKKIEDTCGDMPKEWTILHICKNNTANSTYSTFEDISASEAPVYLSILRHARSAELSTMICLELPDSDYHKIFGKNAKLLREYCAYIENLNPMKYQSIAAKTQFWTTMQWFNEEIELSVKELKAYISPWNFLFVGQLHPYDVNKQYQQQVFKSVDEMCDTCNASTKQRVLLSLAALHVNAITEVEIVAICQALFPEEHQQKVALKLLFEQRLIAIRGDTGGCKPNLAHYPCILVIDEHLEHFFWEELHPNQEYTRINSLQCLCLLYTNYKAKIQNGYLLLDVDKGSFLVNPDHTLEKMEMRMKSFINYWLPHWTLKVRCVPDREQFDEIYQCPCFVYAGHGPGPQLIDANDVRYRRIDAVVFLFGCNSTGLYSPGLYGEKSGLHIYYHAAMCPAVVGTVLPCLDGWMDSIAAHMLSHWLRPSSIEVKPWHYFDQWHWIRTYKLKTKNECSHFMCDDSTNLYHLPNVDATPDYHIGSLCAVVAKVHQRIYNSEFYHTVPYVVRGLPVWNTNVQSFPFTKDSMDNTRSQLKIN